MDNGRLLDGGCRLALAAFLHDLGKLAQRARLFDKDPRRDAHKTLYCPFNKVGGFHTHLHAADTALAFDYLEPHLPELRADDPFPFASLSATDQTDSLINAAAAHHRPETFLQWMIARADRISSGFERDAFENSYNNKQERDDFLKARMLVRFEEYAGPHAPERQATNEAELRWRYPLRPLSPAALMPVAHKVPDSDSAVQEYRALWDWLLPVGADNRGVGLIPKSHRQSWPLWLDHFDTLWLTVAHAIPSATAFGTRPDVSLYDHSKSTAAFAVALWRYHVDRGADEQQVLRQIRARANDAEQPFLLVQGDFSGIQNFIFGGDAVVQKKAARLLRGRSALVSLLSELAATKLLEEMALPPTSLVVNAAGKFLIVAPNSNPANAAVRKVRQEISEWFRCNSLGVAGIGMVATPASATDFTVDGEFLKVQTRLWRALEAEKRQAFDLCADSAGDAVLDADYTNGACQFDSRLPAGTKVDDERAHPLSAAAIQFGEALAKPDLARVLVFRAGAMQDSQQDLGVDFFGYRVWITGDKDASGNFGEQAQSGALVRAFDTALPTDAMDAVAWSGYARRTLSAYVPVHRHDPVQDPGYDGRMDMADQGRKGQLKSFEHLALDDQVAGGSEGVKGVVALGVLKGDIDDLGALFRATLGSKPTFARWAELSRRINAFFTIWVPALCESDSDFHSIYTVYAGGDDFFFVGPWLKLRKFARRLQTDFGRYVAGNSNLHFSAGYVMAKPGFPIRQLALQAEAALAAAKAHGADAARQLPAEKNAFQLHGATISWADWAKVEELSEAVTSHVGADQLSSKYVYGLLQLSEMAADSSRPENARWRSRLYYQTRRFFEARPDVKKEDREERAMALIDTVGVQGIGHDPAALRVALIEHIYRNRG